jgi:oxygen-dependent protoporphyrinogen oxidase
MNKPNNIAIVGAGISGLCIAYWLQKEGYNVTIFEQSDHIGGSIVTERPDGYVVDLGPNSALETSAVLRELVEELGLADQRVYGNAESNKRYILKSGALMQVPMSAGGFVKTRLFSPGAKLRLLREPFLKPTPMEDPSLAEFVRHRLGQEFLDYAINPFVAGVYAGDPETLSASAGFPKLYALEQKYGSLIRGAIGGARERKKRNEVAKDRARLFSFREGMDLLPKTLAGKIGKENMILNTRISGFEKSTGGIELTTIDTDNVGETRSFDRVVFAVPAQALASILKAHAPDAAEKISNVYYPPVAVVFSAYRTEDVGRTLDGFGFLVPQKERRQILGSIWSSTIFPNRAPGGLAAFTTFIGGTRQPELAQLGAPDILDLAHHELADIMGISGEPVFTKVRIWPRAIPQYTVGYRHIQALYDDLEQQMGIYIAGNIRKGISVGDSVLCAHETVRSITGRTD